jgi:ribonuclease T1
MGTAFPKGKAASGMASRTLIALRFPALWLFALTLLLTSVAAADSRLGEFARRLGIRDTAAFVETVESIERTGRLPPRYLTKDEAASRGWKPGTDLCRVAPGQALGGDRFGNREKKLPEKAGRRWQEADLDYACGRRGAKRLVFSSDGLIFVTLDHYETFHQVPK